MIISISGGDWPDQFKIIPHTLMISGPTSYVSTLDEFLAHWAAVNADALAGTGLVTREGTTRADLMALRTDLDGAATDVVGKLNGKEIDRARLENAKRAVLVRTQELGRRFRGVLPVDSPYLKALPELPVITSAQEVILPPVKDFANIWKRVNEDGTDVVLAEGYTLANFTAEVVALSALYTLLNTSVLDLKIAREKRNQLQTAAKAVLSAYRPAVEGIFPPDSPLVNTIPLIYPPAGHTPEAVMASATFDAATQEAVIVFTESKEVDLEGYQVRGVPGPDYNGEDEVVLATIPKGTPRQFHTAFSLAEPGTEASFKVYVILTTGNEAGSKAVTVVRP